MHVLVPYGPIHGQDHVVLKVRNSSILEILPFSKSISSAIFSGSWQVTADSITRGQYLNLIGPDFYRVSAYLAMQSPVLAMIRLSVRPSVCSSVMLALSQNDAS